MSAGLLRRRAVDLALAVLAVVAVVAFFVTRRAVTTAEAEARERNVLGAFRPDELTRVVLERGTERIVLERAQRADAGVPEPVVSPDGDGEEPAPEGEFRIVEPRVGDTGTVAVRTLLDALERAVFVRRLPAAEVDRARFGLDAPRAVVTLAMGSLSYRLVLGGEAVSPPGAAYLEVGGDGVPGRGVGIVRRETVDALLVGLDELRDARLVPFLADEVKHVVLTAAGDKSELDRRGGRWRVVTGSESQLAERATVDQLFLQLGRLDAEVPVPVPEARRLTAAGEAIRVELTPSAGGARVRLVVGGRCPKGEGTVALRLEPDPLAGCVPEDVRPILELAPERWASRHLFGFSPDEVESVLLVQGQRKLDLVRHESAYRLRAPRAADVDLDAGNGRVLALVEARGEPIQDPKLAELGLEPPAGEATLTSAAATEAEVITERVDVGHPDAEGGVAVRRRLDGVVLRLDRQTARSLLPDATLLRSREILDFQPGSVRRIAVTGEVEQELAQPRPGSFELVHPAGLTVDGGLASDLVDALARLETERWVADADDGSFGLAQPRLRVSLTVALDGGRTLDRVLRVGDATTGGAFATLDGDPGVFVLSRRDRARCERLLVDRTLWPAGATPAEIELETPEARLSLTRLGNDYEQTRGEPRLTASERQRLVEALSDLRAEAALHTGPARPNEGLSPPRLTLRLRGDAAGSRARTLTFGAGDAWQGTTVVYARVDGVDATFVVAHALVAAILDLL